MHFNVCTASTRFLICQFPHFFSSPGKELLLQRGYLHFNACPFSSMSTDVDECQTNGTCPEHSTCANTFGSFVCTCNEGFMRNGSVCIGKMWFCHLVKRAICSRINQSVASDCGRFRPQLCTKLNAISLFFVEKHFLEIAIFRF